MNSKQVPRRTRPARRHVLGVKPATLMRGLSRDLLYSAQGNKSVQFMRELGTQNLNVLRRSKYDLSSLITAFKRQGRFTKPSALVKAVGAKAMAEVMTLATPWKMMAFANRYGYAEFVKLIKSQGAQTVGKIIAAA